MEPFLVVVIRSCLYEYSIHSVSANAFESDSHATHISRESGLVTDSRGNTTQKGRHFRTSLGETENVVNEKQHVLTLFITEVFRDGQTSESDTGTGTGGLIHLTEDESDLGVTFEVDDTSLNHFVVQIVTLTSTFSDTWYERLRMMKKGMGSRRQTAENRETTMGLGNVVDEFLNQHSLPYTGTSKQTNLSTTSVRSEKINDLDTGFQNFSSRRLVDEGGRVSVNGAEFDALDRATLINGFSNDVHDASERSRANWNHDGGAGINHFCSTDETLGTIHGNSADRIFTQMRGNLEDEATATKVLNLQGVKDRREVVCLKLDIDNGTNDGFYRTNGTLGFSCVGAGG